MKAKYTIWIGVAVFGIAGLFVMEILRGPRSFFAGFDRDLHAQYQQICFGNAQQSVLKIFGEPIKRSGRINLPQRHGFEYLFDEADNSTAVKFYLWRNGLNWYYCVGFDSSGKVVFKGEGHS